MPGGLFALLDDVATLAKLAATSIDDVGAAAGKATAKAAGVVIDDTAVTPQYVHGISAEREIPIVRKIAAGSIRNKLLIILPVALVLSQFWPGALHPLLMVGGVYLGYEGAEKVLGWLGLHDSHSALELELDEFEAIEASASSAGDEEKALVRGAVRTDLILSTEIMVIALNEVIDESFWTRLSILVVVAFVLTIGVYGVVGVIVKMDDMGVALATRRTRWVQAVGRALVNGMPHLLNVISVVGTLAMLWVGGHLIVVGLDHLHLHWLYEHIHHLAHRVHEHSGAIGGLTEWLTTTFYSLIVGLLAGLLALGSWTLVRRGSGRTAH